MPIDPFAALNALIRAEATRTAEPDTSPAADPETASRTSEEDEK
ncbi:hypothetical protein [Streptomyces lavendofoliae]|uniref:Uncharacterized protein n=1 Tax=Streptomyces lavendofoliae TaxID=67314 RepID=A0A918M1V5_9ACTN|nr:hypothetical protein [Streptomyces lavendofoliae]GGU23637.1 hypothetical protein GCM10010274_07590 [Streptomyces lavendofoliae]